MWGVGWYVVCGVWCVVWCAVCPHTYQRGVIIVTTVDGGGGVACDVPEGDGSRPCTAEHYRRVAVIVCECVCVCVSVCVCVCACVRVCVCVTHTEGESDDDRKMIDSGSTSPRVPAEYARGGLSVSETVERCCTLRRMASVGSEMSYLGWAVGVDGAWCVVAEWMGEWWLGA